MNNNLKEIRAELLSINHESRRVLTIDKTRKALAELKRAQTLIEKASLTLEWARRDIARQEREETPDVTGETITGTDIATE